MDNFSKLIHVSKIAILNPYLQGGHTQIAESESALRFIEAGKNLSIDIKVFANTNELEAFDPDFVVGITYQEPKFSKYPSYISLNIAPSLIKDVPKFIRNILSYDGFMTLSPSVSNWIQQLCAEHNKQMFMAHAAFSVPQTIFQPCDFANATAMYMGTNWDGMRHRDLFNLLKDGAYLKCYGPKKSWANYPDSLYAGEIPFDGKSWLAAYRKHAIGLCINYPAFDDEGISSSRIFEIAAASALPISAQNSLTKQIYGDSILYIDKNDSTQSLAAQIIDHVKWVRAHPEKAQEMAKEAHQKFNQYASMEAYIKNLIMMHTEVMQQKFAPIQSENLAEKVTYIVCIKKIDTTLWKILEDLKNQTYRNIDVKLLVENEDHLERLKLAQKILEQFKVELIKYEGSRTNQTLITQLKEAHTKWIGILSAGDRIFPNHTSVLLKQYADFSKAKVTPVAALRAVYLEYSDSKILIDHMAEQHWVESKNHVRIGLMNINAANSLVNLLFSNRLLDTALIKELNFLNLSPQCIFDQIEKIGMVYQISEITNHYNLDTVTVEKNVHELRDEIQHLGSMVNEQQATLNAIYTSLSWKCISRLRKIFSILRKLTTLKASA